MSKVKNIGNILVLLALMVIGVVNMPLDANAERSWDNKTEKENVLWEKEIENWDKVIKEWNEKRDRLHNTYYEEEYDDNVEYCNQLGCWAEDMFALVFTFKSGLVQEMDKARGDVGRNFTFEDGSTWYCANGGQVLTFNGPDGEFWDSSNHGQVIEYKNANGDRWESSNTGQVIVFEGADGSKWESSNYGQVVEYTDKDGKKWRGSDSDDADDMRWRNN